MPMTETRPAARPCPILRLTTYVTAGPGITSRIAAPVMNNNREECLINMALALLRRKSVAAVTIASQESRFSDVRHRRQILRGHRCGNHRNDARRNRQSDGRHHDRARAVLRHQDLRADRSGHPQPFIYCSHASLELTASWKKGGPRQTPA